MSATTTEAELAAARDALRAVYDLRAEGDRVVVEMTLTTPGCPVSESLPDQAAEAVASALGPGGAARVEVQLVWEPPWTPERLSDDAADRLGLRR